MKTSIRIFAFFMVCGFPLIRASEPKLTVAQEINLSNALAALDGHNVIPRVNGQDQAAANVAYDFSGDVRWKIRDDLQALQPKVDAWQKVSRDILKDVSGGSMVIPVSDLGRQAIYTSKITEASETIDPSPPKLQFLSRADLNLNSNPIPGSVLNLLAPILP